MDDPGRVRSQIITVVYQIQYFDFYYNLELTWKVNMGIPPTLVTNRDFPVQQLGAYTVPLGNSKVFIHMSCPILVLTILVLGRPRDSRARACSRRTIMHRRQLLRRCGNYHVRSCSIEVLNLRPAVSVLLLFATLPECSQNQTAVSDSLRLLSDF